MKKHIAIFSVLLLFLPFAGSALAKSYADQFISLEVPKGFDGPTQGTDEP